MSVLAVNRSPHLLASSNALTSASTRKAQSLFTEYTCIHAASVDSGLSKFEKELLS